MGEHLNRNSLSNNSQGSRSKVTWVKISLRLMVLAAGLTPTLGYILSQASEMGSPTNHLGSGQRRDTDQGPFSPLTGGLALTPTGSLQPVEFN